MIHNPHITNLAQAFHAHGKELYLVGGTVRDELMRRTPKDIDCATNACPEEIKAIASETNPLHIVPIGEKYGTIQIIYPYDVVIEITTYRGERYTPGDRHPEVQFGIACLKTCGDGTSRSTRLHRMR